MKIIELINRIVNKESIPSKFKYDNEVFEYSQTRHDYVYIGSNLSFFSDYMSPIYDLEDLLDILNDDIEIVKAEKDILQERIDKAIEYIEENLCHPYTMELKDILKGE